MKSILGKKIAMTNIFTQDGRMHPATAIKVGPCFVTNVLTKERNGYDAVQMGFDTKRVNRSLAGHYKGVGNFKEGRGFRFVREVSSIKPVTVQKGDQIDINTFEVGEDVTVVGHSKGRGFQGVVKRHGFRGHPATHGHKDQLRMPGSIGAGGVQRVFKGMRMGGHMGDAQITIKGATVLAIDADEQIVYVKGGVPGARNSYVILKAEGDLKITSTAPEVEATPVVEETPVVNTEAPAEDTVVTAENVVAETTPAPESEPVQEVAAAPEETVPPSEPVTQEPAKETTPEEQVAPVEEPTVSAEETAKEEV